MKFSDTQKKWAMTGVLLAVLGFNISPYKSVKGFNVTDLAATATDEDMKTDEITRADGVYEVSYSQSKDNEKKTLAKYRKILTESGAKVDCATCMDSVVLDQPFTTRLDVLNVNLMKMLEPVEPKVKDVAEVRGAKRVKATKVAKEDADEALAKLKKSDSEEDDSVEEDSAFEKGLAAIDSKCKTDKVKKKKASAKRKEQLECLSDELSDLLTSIDDEEIDDKVLKAFIQKKVLPLQVDLILENRKAMSEYYLQGGDAPDETTLSLLEPLEKIIGSIPEGHDGLQTDLVKAATAVKTADLKYIANLNDRARNATGQDKTDLLNESSWRTSTSTSIDRDLQKMADNAAYVSGGMNQASKFSAGLQAALNQAWINYNNGGSSSPDVIQVGNDAYQRISSVNRGGAAGVTQMNTQGVVVPTNVQFAQSSAPMSIITPNGTFQVQAQQPQMYSQQQGQQVQYVPQQQQFVQQQFNQQPQWVAQQTQQQYMQQPPMYSVPQNQYSVPQNQYVGQNQGNVVNMGTFRTGGTTTTLSNGLQVVPRQ